MASYSDRSSTIEKHTFRIIGLAWTKSTTSPSKIVVAPLNLDNTQLEFSKVDGEYPIYL